MEKHKEKGNKNRRKRKKGARKEEKRWKGIEKMEGNEGRKREEGKGVKMEGRREFGKKEGE